MKIVTVLRSGGEYDREYVERIAASVPSQYEFVCISDDPEVPGYVPLRFNYPGWWSKMELFRPGIIYDDIFYIDLDTVIVDNISPELAQLEMCDNMVMLSDFYQPDQLASGVMYIPEDIRFDLWHAWIINHPERVMKRYRGDQDFIRELYLPFLRFEDVVDKDWICSYKAHVIKNHPKHITPLDIDHTKSKIVCFHGKPRPRDVNWRLPDAV